MALMLKSWGWPNPSQNGQRVNASENFHMQLHKCTVKVSKPPIISLQTLEVTQDILLLTVIKIYTLNSVIHGAGLHVIPKPCHTQNKHTYTCNSF